MATAVDVKKALAELADPQRAKSSAWFFKTGEGQYGAGDVFIGISVPEIRAIAARHSNLDLSEVAALLASEIHEHRLAAVVILRHQFEKGTPAEQKAVFEFYLQQTSRINNWDLVDASASYIVGASLVGRWRKVLPRLARSKNIWERRIAIVATFHFIKLGDVEPTLAIAEKLLGDKHDLIHKAVGWALREAIKKGGVVVVTFLRTNYSRLPRTTLRYAIERFSPEERAEMLRGVFR